MISDLQKLPAAPAPLGEISNFVDAVVVEVEITPAALDASVVTVTLAAE